MADDLTEILPTIPVLAGWQGTPQRLGGLTNRVWRVGGYVLRLPGPGTEAYINRRDEAAAAHAAARAGVSPAVVFVDPTSGIMVTRFIAGTVTMTPKLFAIRPGAVARAALALRQLHQSGETFPARFELFAMIDDYLRLLAGTDVALPEGYHAAVAEAGMVRAALAAQDAALAPCHCDPLCENFLDTPDRMWLVD